MGGSQRNLSKKDHASPQRILLEKDYINQESVFLPTELDALMLVAEQLCHTLPDVDNPFSLGIGTRRLIQDKDMPQVELMLSHVRLSDSQPRFGLDDCRKMLDIAARPMDHLAELINMQDYCDQTENALKSGIAMFSNQMALSSIKDDGGWFVIGLKFERALTLESNIFAVAFLTGIARTIFAMDESNNRLRAGYAAFLANCENWSIDPPEKQLHEWLYESGFKNFASCHYARSGPRKFFG